MDNGCVHILVEGALRADADHNAGLGRVGDVKYG